MAIVFALSAAVAYGSADFVGGLASRRTPPVAAAFGAQVGGLLLLLVALPALGGGGPEPSHLLVGAAAGVFGGVGLVLLYRSLARGPMSIVAPTTALSASMVPIFAGVLLGERPGPVTFVGIAVSLVAVVLITREPSAAGTVAGADRRVIGLALTAGAIFGMFFVVLHQAGDGAGLWPLLGARLVSVPLLLVLARRQAAALAWTDPSTLPRVLLSGTLDMAANIAYLLALRHGMLSVVAAITGLYPASTVLLAQAHLDERLHRTQLTGLATAAVAAVLIAVA
ncbi:MAG: DMT family transporter [Acidimicrobiales bacterium]|nr:DMT family transporter [Acidimicrobiales bacterium]HRW36725.1 DMT family transporter [Aquihabitans sp.]